MRFLIVVVLAICLVVSSIMGMWLFDPVRVQAETLYRTQVDAIALARQQADMQRDRQERDALMPVFALVKALLSLGGAVGVVGLMGIGLWILWDHRVKTKDLYASNPLTGAWYAPREALTDLALTHTTGRVVALIEGRRNPVHQLPNGLRSFTYAPRQQETRGRMPTSLPAPSTGSALPSYPTPSFTDVVQSLPPRQIALGVGANGQPRYLGLDAIGATLVVGQRGSGKSTTLTALVAQCVAHLDARLWVIDCHAAHDQSLAQRLSPLRGAFITDIGSSLLGIEGVLSQVEAELEARLAGEAGEPVILVIDEVTEFFLSDTWASVGRRIGAVTQRIATGGRKINFGVMAAGHLSNQDSLGGSFAYTASAFIAHTCVPDLIRRFVGPDAARQARNLPPGHVIAQYPGGVERLVIPEVKRSDLYAIGDLLDRHGQSVRQVVVKGAGNDSPSWSEPSPPKLTEVEQRLLTLAVNEFNGSFPIGRLFDLTRGELSKQTIDTAALCLQERGLLTGPGEYTQGGRTARRMTEAAYTLLGGMSAHPPIPQTAMSDIYQTSG